MKKIICTVLTLTLCALVLASCGKKEDPLGENVLGANAVQPQNLYEEPQQSEAPSEEYNFDAGEYNPASEEATGFEDAYEVQPVAQADAAETLFMVSEYAGATPIIIDPVDKPTPTPVPPLSFTYQLYQSSSMGISFEAPVGWLVDESVVGQITLTNPSTGMDYQANAVISAEKTSSDYTAEDLKNVAKSILDSIKNSGLKSFSPSLTAERNLLDKNGVYANYTAVTPEGANIAGRIHVVEVDRTLYTVKVSYPKEYTSTYVDGVYTKIRKTMKITK